MPYQDIPGVLETPGHPNAMIWRYMDLAKYVAMLDKRALFFARADKMPDRFEGSLPLRNVSARAEIIPDFKEEHPDLHANFLAQMSNANRNIIPHVLLNCWHLNNYESAAMWDLYGQRGAGIAIRSTFARLCSALNRTEQIVVASVVRYIDFKRDFIQHNNVFTPFTYKRMSFKHEQEIRALTLVYRGPQVPPLEQGMNVECDLETLIEGVYVSPESPSWFADVVRSVTARYGAAIEPTQSDLSLDPVY